MIATHGGRAQEYMRILFFPIARWRLAAFLLILTLTCAFASAAQAGAPARVGAPLRVGVYDNRPLVFVDEDGRAQGVYIDLLEHIAQQEGWQLQYVAGTWQQCLDQLDSGAIDLLAAIAYSEDLTPRYDFNQRNVISNWAQVYTPRGAEVSTLLDLEGKRLAVVVNDVHGRNMLDMLRRFNITSHIIEADDYETVLQLVRERNVDAGVVSRLYSATRSSDPNVVQSSLMCCPIEMRFATLPGRFPSVLEAIDRHLATLSEEQDSVYYRSLGNWMGGIVPRWTWPRWLTAVAVGIAGLLLGSLALSALLRDQVQARTAELEAANQGLRREVAVRRRAEAVQAALFQMARAASLSDDLCAFLRVTHEQLSELIDCANFYVALYDPTTQLYSFPYCVDQHDAVSDIPPDALRYSLTDYVRRTGEALWADEAVHRQLIARGEAKMVGTPSLIWLGAPLKTAQGAIGVVTVQSYTNPFAYTEEDLSLLEFVGSQIAAVIERKTTEAALRESEARYRALFDQAADSIMLVDAAEPEPIIMDANIAACAAYGHTRQEMIGLPFARLMFEGDAPLSPERIVRLKAGETLTFEARHMAPDGARSVEVSARPIEIGGRTAIQIIDRDVTERHKLEARLRQSQKMEAIGQLAGGVAHDFNNLLTIINGYSQLLMNELDEADPLWDEANEIRKAGDRAATLTRQLLAFSRRQVLQLRVLNLNDIVSGMARMLERLIGEHISLDTRLAGDLGNVRADAGQIEQVLVNLAVNARDAMPDGGALTIRTTNIVVDAALAAEHAGLAPGQYALLSVSDTGCGMNDEVKAHLFEPFFTTKGPGKGTGLGLATVYGIIKQSGGSIYVRSEPNQGAAFDIYLPRVDERSEANATPGGKLPLPKGKETILVVEDEANVRDLVARTLQRLGYRVLQAANGVEALDLWERRSGPIDLVLTDIVMPEMGGVELSRQLHERDRAVKVAFMSGYADSHAAGTRGQRGSPDLEAMFLPKPFTVEILGLKVRAFLAHRQAADEARSSATEAALRQA